LISKELTYSLRNMEYSVLLNHEVLFGNSFLESLHGLDPILGSVLAILSFVAHNLGSNIFFLCLLSIVYLCFSPKLGSEMAIGLLSSGIINSLAKFFFESPRPQGLAESIVGLQSKAEEFAFGFPSGHVQSSLVIWGLLFIRIKNTTIRSICIFIIFLMPFSRMYIGVHYLGDVIGGFFLGIVNLILLIWFTNSYPEFPQLDHFSDKSKASRSLILLFIAITLSPVLLYQNISSIPHIASLNTLLSSTGALGGFLSGAILLKLWVLVEKPIWSSYIYSEKPLQTLAMRNLVLVLVILFLYLLPSIIFKKFSWGDEVLLRYLRYFIAGFAIVFISPYILYKWKDGTFMRNSQNA
jgi:membrane-associated phospholipid phosphatase